MKYIFYLSAAAYCRIQGFWERLKKDTKGMGTIEVIIILAVLVALALVFRSFITDLAKKLFDKIQEKADAAVDAF